MLKREFPWQRTAINWTDRRTAELWIVLLSVARVEHCPEMRQSQKACLQEWVAQQPTMAIVAAGGTKSWHLLLTVSRWRDYRIDVVMATSAAGLRADGQTLMLYLSAPSPAPSPPPQSYLQNDQTLTRWTARWPWAFRVSRGRVPSNETIGKQNDIYTIKFSYFFYTEIAYVDTRTL